MDKLYCTYFRVNDIIFAYLPCKLPAVQEPFDLCPETISIRQRVLCKKKKTKAMWNFSNKNKFSNSGGEIHILLQSGMQMTGLLFSTS